MLAGGWMAGKRFLKYNVPFASITAGKALKSPLTGHDLTRKARIQALGG